MRICWQQFCICIVDVQIGMYIYTCAHVIICMGITCICIIICMHVYICIHVCVQIYGCMHINNYVYICMHVACLYIYIACVYVCA